jgi:O-antigen/teichoic acid export membrane protein
MSGEDNLLKNTLWIGLATAFVALSDLATIPILVKLKGCEIYGIWVTYITIVKLLTPLSLLGLHSAFIRFSAGSSNKDKLSNDFYSALICIFLFSLFISILLSFNANFIVRKFSENSAKAEKVIETGTFLIFIWALELYALSYYRAFLRLKKYSLLIVFQTSVEILFLFLLMYVGYTLVTVAYSFIMIRGIISIALLIEINKEIGFRLPDFKCIPSYILYGLPLVCSTFFGWVVKLSDRIIIGYFLDFSAIGIYSASYDIATVIMLYLATLQGSLYPTVSTLWNKNKIEETKQKLSLSLKYFLLFAIPTSFGLSVLSKQVLRVFTKPEFIMEGHLIIPVVAFGITCYGIYSISMYVMTLVKKTYVISVILGISAVINIALNILLIPRMNIMGAAIATLITFIFSAIAMALIALKNLKFCLNSVFIIKSIIASGTMAFVIHQLPISNLKTLIFAIFTGIVVYGMLIFLSRGISKEEIMSLRSSFFK